MRRRDIRTGLSTLLWSLVVAAFAATTARAHPHVWISVRCEFVFNADREPVGLIEHWTFDEMYSSVAVMDVSRDRDGKRSPGALASSARAIVTATKSANFFTIATVGGRPISFQEPREIEANFSGDKLSVRFRFDFREPIRLGGDALRIEVHDPDLFADFQFSDTQQVEGLPPTCAVRLDEPNQSLPSDPQAVMDALINGPVLTLAGGIELTCGTADAPETR